MTYKEFIDNILETRGRIITEGYKESHHILPRCLGGEDVENNLIDLYAKEHFMAHKLLAIENPDNAKLVYAWHCMCCWFGPDQERDYECSPEDYALAKELYGKNHYWRTEKSRQEHSESMKRRWEELKASGKTQFGNLHEIMQSDAYRQRSRENAYKYGINKARVGAHASEETRKKMGAAQKGRIITEEAREKISQSLKKYYAEHPVSKETREKQGAKSCGSNNPNYGKPSVLRGTHFYTNGIEEVRATECPDGWHPGRKDSVSKKISETKTNKTRTEVA